MLRFDSLESVSTSGPSDRSGVYRDVAGEAWYLKWPDNPRQGDNERMASKFYRHMGFEAVDYVQVDNGMLASPFRERTPPRSDPTDLRGSSIVQEAFLPSVWLANWDVTGLVYDNILYDPDTMEQPLFIDFGGSFDTRALGLPKAYDADTLPSLTGLLSPSINREAASIFGYMSPEEFTASQSRVTSVSTDTISAIVEAVGLDGPAERVEALEGRQDIIKDLTYKDVFPDD